jgi:hypothetical protein
MPCHSSGRTVRTRRGHPSDKTAFRVVPRSPRKAISPRTVHPRRGGLRTPGRNGWVWPRHVGIGPRATGLPRSCNETPRHALGLAMLSIPGGAGSARPRERFALDRSISLLGHRPFVRSSVIMPYPGLAYGLALRTRRARPSEKTPLVLSPGVSPQGHLPLGGPPRGGAGSARPQGMGEFGRGMSASGYGPPVYPGRVMKRLGMR